MFIKNISKTLWDCKWIFMSLLFHGKYYEFFAQSESESFNYLDKIFYMLAQNGFGLIISSWMILILPLFQDRNKQQLTYEVIYDYL